MSELITKDFREIAADYRVIFFDSYGVLRNHSGMIPGARETIESLRRAGKTIRVLTNNAARSQEGAARRLASLGLPGFPPEEIVTSGMMARQYLEEKAPGGRAAYLGTRDAAEYIVQAKLQPVPISELDLDNIDDIAAMVFLDDEGYDWNTDINKTINLLRKKSIPAIVANSDKLYPVAKNDVAVATGGLARVVESILGRQFIHFGKPDTQMFSYAFASIQQEGYFQRRDVLMVGDTLHTDILGGNKFGIHTALVLSGNTHRNSALREIESTGVIPDHICTSIGHH
jgi:HAD superfamily hydrolase (TIGR01450 family)